MYHHIKGTLTHVVTLKDRAEVVVEACGVGYLLRVSLTAAGSLGDVGQTVELLTHLAVREDAMTLYGFANAGERALFEALIGVKNIGPPKALSILSGIPPGRAAAAIREGDTATFKQVRGIGDKAAKMIVVELKGKVDALAALTDDDFNGVPGSTVVPSGGPFSDAVDFLVRLGLSEPEARRRVSNLSEQPHAKKLAVDDIVRECLSA